MVLSPSVGPTTLIGRAHLARCLAPVGRRTGATSTRRSWTTFRIGQRNGSPSPAVDRHMGRQGRLPTFLESFKVQSSCWPTRRDRTVARARCRRLSRRTSKRLRYVPERRLRRLALIGRTKDNKDVISTRKAAFCRRLSQRSAATTKTTRTHSA